MKRCMEGETKSLAGTFDVRTSALLFNGHLAAAVHGPRLREALADELASADDKLEEALKAMANEMRKQSPTADMTSVTTLYRTMGQTVLQAVRDTDSAAVSVNAADDAIQIEEPVTVGT